MGCQRTFPARTADAVVGASGGEGSYLGCSPIVSTPANMLVPALMERLTMLSAMLEGLSCRTDNARFALLGVRAVRRETVGKRLTKHRRGVCLRPPPALENLLQALRVCASGRKR